MVPNSAGDTATVSFKVSTPVLSTRAVGDGTTAKKLYVAVYENQNGTLAGPLDVSLIDDGETVAFNNDRVATVNLALAKNKEYSVIFWAETENNGEAMFDINWDERKLTLKQSLKANQEKYDAFWAQKTVNISENLSQDVKLTRPFSQLNIGTSDKTAAAAAGIEVENSQVVVKGAYTTFNLQSGEATNEGNVTYAMEAIAAIEGESFPAAGQSYLSLNYLLMNADKSTVDVTFSYEDEEDTAPYTLNFNSVPVQRNYRTNIYGTLLTNSANYTVEILPGFGENGEQDAANVVYATTADDVMKALAANEENIKIVLLNDITLDGGTGTEYGTGVTKEIIIEGNSTATRGGNAEKFTLTYKDGYRTYVKMANAEGKLVFKNLNLCRNTTSTNTHWHDNNMKFCCNTEFENVDFNKGICFDDAKTFDMKNCSINKSKVATYALFITAGCNVTIDGLSITHSEGVAGRGIKIVDEDVDNKEALTTLSVSNATFVTEAKAAILVGSQGGANITLENINLAGVKADGFNAVWVDEDYKDYAGNVTVDGGFKIVEGTAADSNPFLEAGATVNVAKGVYSTLPKVADGVTIIAEEGTVFNGTSGISGENVTIKNVIFKGDEKALTGNLKGTTFENCQFDATYGAQWCYAYGDVTFKNCVFGSETSKRGIHFDGGDGNVAFESCTFYAFNALGQANKKYSFNDCDIKVSSQALNKFNGVNMYGTTYEYTNCRFAPGTFTDCAGNNVVATYNNCSYTDARSIYSVVRFDKDPATCTITFDGKHYVANANALKAALANGEVTDIYLAAGKTFEGKFYIEANKNLISDAGNQATIKGRVWIKSTSPTFKNVTFDRNETHSNEGNETASNALKYKAVVMIYGDQTNTIKFEECKFLNNNGTNKSAITNVACELIVDKCYFEGYSSGIYSQANLSITNSTFNYTGGNNVIASINGCGDNGGKFIFKGNTITNKIFALSQFLSTVEFGNGTYHFDVQGNTGEGFDHYFLNGTRVAKKTFAEGSETF